jgi:SAM-dependent methyltransferase
MKKCLACGQSHAASLDVCPNCLAATAFKGGFRAYAPALADASGGFRESYFAELAPLEERNFWFRVRNRLIIWALRTYCSSFHSMLEIGCGTGYVLSGIADAFPKTDLHGSEIFTAGLEFAASRQPSADFMQMDARHIPYLEEFDVVGAFDVLEHIQEDDRVLAEIFQALVPGGMMLLTVPQHAWLWSAVDDYACHVQRYSARSLHDKVRAAGFEIVRSTSFVSSLLPMMYASRLLKRAPIKETERVDEVAELNIAPWLNSALEKMLAIDFALIRSGIDLPLGGSRLVVAKKIAAQGPPTPR